MNYEPVVISLPITDRPTSHDFYRRALGMEAFGEPVDDGVPEPLQFVVNAGVRLILIPRGGFGWVIGDGQVTPPGHHECLLGIGTATQADTDALVERAVAAGADLVTPRDISHGATRARSRIPMGTSGWCGQNRKLP